MRTEQKLKAIEGLNLILAAKNMTCDLVLMDGDTYRNAVDVGGRVKEGAVLPWGRLVLGDWYVVVTCVNGYKYYVNVSFDSSVWMCAEVLNCIANK